MCVCGVNLCVDTRELCVSLLGGLFWLAQKLFVGARRKFWDGLANENTSLKPYYVSIQNTRRQLNSEFYLTISFHS
jgi:hypothetical protein